MLVPQRLWCKQLLVPQRLWCKQLLVPKRFDKEYGIYMKLLGFEPRTCCTEFRRFIHFATLTHDNGRIIGTFYKQCWCHNCDVSSFWSRNDRKQLVVPQAMLVLNDKGIEIIGNTVMTCTGIRTIDLLHRIQTP